MILFLLFPCFLLASRLLLQAPNPQQTGLQPLGLIFASSLQIQPSQYTELFQKLQLKVSQDAQLWVSIVQIDLLTNEAKLQKEVENAIEELTFALEKEEVGQSQRLRLFFGGHSKGGLLMQDLLKKTFDGTSTHQEVKQPDSNSWLFRYPNAGMILWSNALQRKYRPDQQGSFLPHKKFPILTIGGELDGLFRSFRLAESLYHGLKDSSELERPHLLIKGAAHHSFFSGKMPLFVKWKDLKAEISQEDAWEQITEMTRSFLVYLTRQDVAAAQYLVTKTQDSLTYLKPVLDSLLLEGSIHLKPFCNEIKDDRDCWKGSKWTEYSQQQLAHPLSIQTRVEDAIWKVWLVNPVHLPATKNQCAEPKKSCLLEMTTVSQPTYTLLDNDSGYAQVSADEIRAKMNSVQSVYYNAGIKNANFTLLDDDQVCKHLNEKSYQWALNHAPESIRNRFSKQGIPMQIGKDKGPYNTGPNWIWMPLEMKQEKIVMGSNPIEEYLVVSSPTMRTPMDYPISFSRGFHYCKLLSPARAMEWIYLDGLREAFKIK